jgi:glycosyltransferase involved in cell wall biosynthesis
MGVPLDRMRVALLAGTLGQGGAERQLFYIANALRDRGAVVSVLSLTRSEFWESRIASLGVPVTWAGSHRSRLIRLSVIISHLRRTRPHVIQSQHFYANLYACVAARVTHTREIGAIRNTVDSEVEGLGRWSGKASLRLPRMIAVNSRAAVDRGIALGVPASRLFFLQNVVDTERFAPAVQVERTTVRLLAVGRLVPQKRFDRFIRLVARLSACSGRSMKALLVGSGPLKTTLMQQAAELNLSADTLEIRAASPEMTEIYQAADILVLCSDAEGMPNVILEAMASGLPVVATRVGGIAEIVRHGVTGFIVEPNDEENLFRSVSVIAGDGVLRRMMGERAREHVLAECSLDGLPAALSQLYAAASFSTFAEAMGSVRK